MLQGRATRHSTVNDVLPKKRFKSHRSSPEMKGEQDDVVSLKVKRVLPNLNEMFLKGSKLLRGLLLWISKFSDDALAVGTLK